MAATTLSSSAFAAFAGLSSSRSSIHGSSAATFAKVTTTPSSYVGKQCLCKASSTTAENEQQQEIPRRVALGVLVAAVTAAKVSTANAAYGEAANVFGSPKKDTGFTTYTGDGFKLDIPSKWNPSPQLEFPGTVLRYEDNFDPKSNFCVIVNPTDKKSITEYGSPEEFLGSVNFLLGKQIYSGKTSSEGGFEPNAVASASLLGSKTKEVGGKTYYDLDILTRTADGDEGGTHQLIAATVKDGKLYVLKAQAGDKRWFKGAQKFVKGTVDSFSVA